MTDLKIAICNLLKFNKNMIPKYNKTAILCIIYLINIFNTAHSQSLPTTLQSPNAASLGDYGRVPVSLYSGSASIQTPIFNIEEQYLQLAIYLDYKTTGVRADEHPGWVGTNFRLEAGGVITRKIKSAPDDYVFKPGNIGYESKIGYYYNTGELTNANQINNFLASQTSNDYITREYEPDEFFFSLPGLSGSFYFNSFGQIEVKCNRHVVVRCTEAARPVPDNVRVFNQTSSDQSANTTTFYTFELVTDDGTKYTFGGSDNMIEYGTDFYNQKISEWFANAWYLNTIEHPTGMKITFTYERDRFLSQMFLNISNRVLNSNAVNGVYYKSTFFGLFNVYNYSIKGPCSSPMLTSTSEPLLHLDGMLISPVYLTKISSPSYNIYFERTETNEVKVADNVYNYKIKDASGSAEYYVKNQLPYVNSYISSYTTKLNPVTATSYQDPVFSYTPQYAYTGLVWKKLDRIRIEDAVNRTTIRNVLLSYLNDSDKKLTLSEVQFPDRKYTFLYDDFDKSPPYFSNQVDNWGYFNGVTPPALTVQNVNSYQSYRNTVDLVKMQSGTMTRIVQPTGAITKLFYEPHDYSALLKEKRWEGVDIVSNTQTGGLRIKKIVTYPSVASYEEIESKEYFYVKNYSKNNEAGSGSSGILGGRIKYFYDYAISAFGNTQSQMTMSVLSDASVLPACMNTDTYIGYTEVYEKSKDGSYSKYVYSNFDNGYLDEAPHAIMTTMPSMALPYGPYTSKSGYRGNLLKREDYNNTGVLVKKQEIGYSTHSEPAIFSCNLKIYQPCNIYVFYPEGTIYQYNLDVRLPSNEVETTYDLAGQKISERRKNTIYNRFKLPAKEVLIVNGKDQVTNNFYSGDISLSLDNPKMMSANMVGYLVHSYKTFDGKVINGSVIEYDSLGFGLPRRMYDIESNNILETQYLANSSFMTYYGKPNVIINNNGKDYPKGSKYFVIPDITEIRDMRSGLVSSFFWDYHHKLLADVKNATRLEIENISAQNNLDISNSEQLKILRKKIPKAHITSYSYERPFGVSSITNIVGFSTYYKYNDTNGWLNRTYYQNSDGSESTLQRFFYNFINK